MRDLLLQEPRFFPGRLPRLGARDLEGSPTPSAAYPYVFVDARYEKVRVDHKVVNWGVLVVSGVRDDGFREVLGVGVTHTESLGPPTRSSSGP